MYDIFVFCGEKGIYRIAIPPMGSGNCQYPTKVTSQAFFDGMMDYLDINKLKTSITSITICIIDEKKTKEFQDEWEKRRDERFPEGFGEDSDDQKSEDDEQPDEVENDQEEEEKIPNMINKINKNQALKPAAGPINAKPNNFSQVKKNAKIESDDSSDDDRKPAGIAKPAAQVKPAAMQKPKVNTQSIGKSVGLNVSYKF